MELMGGLEGWEETLTDGQGVPSNLNTKERSRIMRKLRLLCGMAAMGLMRMLGGRLRLRVSQGMRRAYPFLIFSWVSCRSASAALGSLADGWGPRLIAFSSSWMEKDWWTSAGHP